MNMIKNEIEGTIESLEAAFREYRTTNDNPCGGCVYYEKGESYPWRVHFVDGCVDESFMTPEEAREAIEDYADQMDAEAIEE